MLVLQGGVHGLQVADARVSRPMHLPVALLGAVLAADFQRVHAQSLGDLVDDRFRRKSGVGGAWGAVGGRLGLVHHHVIAVHRHVRNRVGREDAHGASGDRRARERAGLVHQVGLRGHNAAVVGSAHL